MTLLLYYVDDDAQLLLMLETAFVDPGSNLKVGSGSGSVSK
jgi:hypothetical protein